MKNDFANSIALVVAMNAEALAIATRLGLRTSNKTVFPYNYQRYESAESMDVALFTSPLDARYGVEQVATQPAALLSDYVLRTHKPSVLINAGTAGGFEGTGAKIGDVYLGYPEIIFHDRRIPIPGFDEYGVGHFSTPPLHTIAKSTGCKLGVISTGNSLDHTNRDLLVMKQYGAVIKDMEAASHALVAQMYEVPFVAIKAVTDLIDQSTPPEDQFLTNLRHASAQLAEKVFTVIRVLISQPNALRDDS